MQELSLVIFPDPIFIKQAAKVLEVDDLVRNIMDKMLRVMKREHAVGISAPMVGISKSIIVFFAHNEEDPINPKIYYMANPEIIEQSKEMQVIKESSLSILGVEAEVTRPNMVKIRYLDYNNQLQEVMLQGFEATVAQHEIDYLHGKTFLNYLSPVKKRMLIAQATKFKKMGGVPHVHGEHCNH